MNIGRFATGAAGVGLTAYGLNLLLATGNMWNTLVWLAGAVALHDGLLAPAVLTTGLLLSALKARGPIRAGLLAAGSLTVIALPPLLRPGAPANETVLPLDYLRNWLILLATVALVTTLIIVTQKARQRRRN